MVRRFWILACGVPCALGLLLIVGGIVVVVAGGNRNDARDVAGVGLVLALLAFGALRGGLYVLGPPKP